MLNPNTPVVIVDRQARHVAELPLWQAVIVVAVSVAAVSEIVAIVVMALHAAAR